VSGAEGRSRSRPAGLIRAFGLLNVEQKAAAVGAVLLVVSTFGPFSFVEAAEILVALAVLALLRARALGRRFHLPLGDGTAIAAAGLWAAGLIVVRLLDRPLGQNLLALACAAILVAAGARERAKRPADDVPPEHGPPPGPRPRRSRRTGDEPTVALANRRGPSPAPGEEPTEPLPPPEFRPYRPAPNEQLRLGREGGPPQPPGDG
jgi:hypothetical protein